MAGPAPAVPDNYKSPIASAGKQWAAGLVLALSNLMVVLDLTIANVSVPHIAGNLGISLDQGTWIITSYAVAEAVCVPLTGWLAMRFGVTKVFVTAIVGFGLFSLFCGLAPTLGLLVAARIGQGLFGAPLMPMSQTLMMLIFPPERRGKVMALWAMTTLIGPALGPIVGGWISDNWSWHWIFLINVPIAAAVAFAGMIMLRPVQTPTRKVPIDRVGLGLLVFWIGCLQVVLDTGREHDWFADTQIVLFALAAGIGFIVFVIWELTEEHPVVDLRVFRHIGFSSAVFTMTIAYGAFFAGNVVTPQWLQSTLGYSAQDSGIVTASSAVAAIFVAGFAGKYSTRVDPRLMLTGGLLWMALSMWLRAEWTTGQGMWAYAFPLFLQGFGMPFFFIPLTNLTLSTVDRAETASAAGLQAFMRTIAVAVSTSLVLTEWGNYQRIVHNEIANSLNPDAAMAALEGMGIPAEGARAYINGLVDREAITVAMNHTTVISVIAVLIATGVVWLAPKPVNRQSMGEGGGGH